MATISFANLDETLSFKLLSLTSYSSTITQTGSTFEYDSFGGEIWDLSGSGLTYTSGTPDAGIISSLTLGID